MGTDVSVIVAERGPGQADGAIASALGQNDVATDVIVLGRAPAEPACTGDPRVLRITNVPRAGPAALYNLGAAHASGAWLAFLDEEDRWAPDHLSRMVTGCTSSNSDFGCSAAWIVDGEGCIHGFRSVPPSPELERSFLRGDGVPSPSALLVRRAFWEGNGGFDDWLWALVGLDLCIRWSRCAAGWVDSAPTLAMRSPEPRSPAELRRLRDEFRELDRRYGQDARALGERFGGGELSALLTREHIRSGDYARAARWAARNADRRSIRLFGQLLALALTGTRSSIAKDAMRPVPARQLRWQSTPDPTSMR